MLILIVDFGWVETSPRYPNIGCMNTQGYYKASVSVEGVGTLLATEKSPLIWREYEEKVYHRAGQENFLREEIPDIKDKMKQDITSKALARAVEALEKLGATKTGSYKIVDHTYNDSLGNIWFSNKPTVSDGSISS